MLLDVANNFKDYLPIYLPFTFALLSIIAGIATERIRLSFEELLKVHGDMILGLFSFVTWGLVTYFQSGRVDLNADHFLDISHVFLLLVLTFLLLLVSIIALRHKWTESRLLGVVNVSPTSLQNWVNGSVLFVCCVAAFFPFFLKQSIASAPKDSMKVREYRVAVPFSDQTLIGNIGEYRWRSRLLCQVEEVMASTESEAKQRAVQKFLRSDNSAPVISQAKKVRKGESDATPQANPVIVLSDKVVVNELHR